MGEAIIELDRDQLSIHFFESYELIRKGETTGDVTRFGKAIDSLKEVVEPVIRGLYQESKKFLSEAEIAQIESTFINKQGRCKFNDLPMGDEFSVLYLGYTSACCAADQKGDGSKRTKINLIDILEKQHDVKLNSVRKLQQEFIKLRNIHGHSKGPEEGSEEPITLSDAIRQQNNVSALLTGLGFEGFTPYQTSRFDRFAQEFERCERRYTRILRTEFKLEKGILPKLREEGGREWSPDQLLRELNKSDNKNYMIIGAGGAGKSTTLRYISEEYKTYNQKFNDSPSMAVGWDFRPIPIMISATELSYRERCNLESFTNDIGRLTRQDGLETKDARTNDNIVKKADDLAALWNREDVYHKPFFIVLIDGLNEIAGCSKELQEEFNKIFRELEGSHIKVVVTSRDQSLAIGSENNFRVFQTSELGDDQIKDYIKQRSPSISKESSKIGKFSDVLNNPMLLTLYTTNQDFSQSNLDKEAIAELKKDNRLPTIEAEAIKRSFILWNFIQYSILFGKVYSPYLDAVKKGETERVKKLLREQEERNVLIISEMLPLIAWHMVSNGSITIERLPAKEGQADELDKLIAQYVDDQKNEPTTSPGLIKLLESPKDVDEALDYLVKVVCILCYEENKLKFTHQNFRDFFAASYFVKKYMSLTGRQGRVSEFHKQLSSCFVPSELRLTVGELLDGLSRDGKDPLSDILSGYQEKCNAGDSNDCAIVNIFDIKKAMGALDLTQFLNTDMDRLNLNDVETTKILQFIQNVLNEITMDSLASGFKLIGKSEKNVATIRLQNLLMLSLRFASNLKKSDVRTILEIWLVWIRKVYNNSTDAPSKSIKGKLFYAMMSIDKLKVFLLTEVLSSFVFEGNMGIGDNSMTNIFQEVHRSKPAFEKSMIILKKKAKGIDNSEIVNSIYSMASSDGLATNFVAFILDYYLVINPVGAYELVELMRGMMDDKDDPEKRTLSRFRLMSGINFAAQESLFINGREPFMSDSGTDALDLRSKYMEVMNDLLDEELKGLAKNNEAYRAFKYGYYFPFGILFAFDCATRSYVKKDEKTIEDTICDAIASGDDRSRLLLFQKVLLDIASVSSCTFFEQSEAARASGLVERSYLDQLFYFLKRLIKGLIDASTNSGDTEAREMAWKSLGEALTLMYCSHPLKVEEFIDQFVRDNANKISSSNINQLLGLKNDLRSSMDNELKYLCSAKNKGEVLSIDEFVENKKNVWIFADLASNMFLSFPNLTEALTVWGDSSFYFHIEDYGKNPKLFVKNSVKELIYLLENEPATKRLLA